MKALISKRSIVIASISVIIALITIISVNAFSTTGPVTGAANVIMRPIRGVVTEVASAFGNIFSAMYRYEELERQNDELSQTIAQLRLDAYDAILLSEENEMFRALFEFRERHAGLDHELATVQIRSSDNFIDSFVINRGYLNSNVRVGMGVTTEFGVLIGQLSYVGATQSTVRTVLDTTFAAAVFVGGYTADGSDGTATARGDFAHMRNGLLVLDYFDDDLAVIPGSHIVTSGVGGVFPPGLTIGYVVEVSPHASGIGLFATIRPQRDLGTIRAVFVILDFDVDDPIFETPGTGDFDIVEPENDEVENYEAEYYN
ncbi:MAG: rod shape-determining protein MreC [Oscillospiraceae bacterium]|nr:rod shape-determining protein MreC [Oscillospiraceae bacterium]